MPSEELDVMMARCPRCDREGRRQEIAVALTRWTGRGIETTLRCPRCGWEDTPADPAAASDRP
jgi:C4-type Zn-finger protein